MQTAIYMRVSTSRQANEGESLSAQSEILHRYISDHNHTLVDEYIDEGISGTKYAQRDELQRMLSDVENGKIELIIFTKLDRFFRSVKHFMTAQDILAKHNVEWIAVSDPEYDKSLPTGKMLLTIMAAFAEMEADMTSQRIKTVFDYKRGKGEVLTGRVPYGYKIIDKIAVPDESRAPIVRSVFQDYAASGNVRKVIRKYASHGVPSTNKSMRTMLSNTTYIGEHDGNAKYCEPIIDRNTFYDVQRKLKMNISKKQKHDYIFSGLLICGSCGRHLTSCCGKYKDHYYLRYRCEGYYGATRTCSFKKAIREEKLERYILDQIKEQMGTKVSAEIKKPKDNSAKIKAIERKISRLKDLYIDELIDINTYKSDLERFRAEIESFKAKPNNSQKALEELSNMTIKGIYDTLSPIQKRRMWQAVIKQITIYDDHIDIEFL